jgi:outer membrane protein OmpA-like peptidoglycan-associated protein
VVLCELQLPDTFTELCPKAYAFKGKVMDSETHQPLIAALTIQSLDLENPHTSEYSTNHLGTFLSVLPKKAKLALFVESRGYYSKSLFIDLSDIIQETEIYLRSWQIQESEVLNNVFFRIGSSELEPISEIELNRLSNFLQSNPTIRLAIEGHTDDLGNNEKNSLLSLKRAEEVVNYLIKTGIKPQRLEAKGYGANKPLLQNNSEAARQKNRRVTWQVIE